LAAATRAAFADADAVVDLVALLEAAQDGDGVLDRGLAHHHRLEAALQRLVLLDVLAVLVQGGGADAAQIPAGQRRLEQVGRVRPPPRRPRRPTRVCSSSMNRMMRPSAGGHLLEHRLDPVLELTAELGPGHQRAQVQGLDALVLE
jgi:hypothetical protein